MHGDPTRPIRTENRIPQAGKTRLRLIVVGTRRAAIRTPACTKRTLGTPRPSRRAPSQACAAFFVRSERPAPTVSGANGPNRFTDS
jgi:hypothetical protein